MRRFSIMLNAGTFSGLLSFGWFLLLYLGLNANPFGGLSWATIIIPVVFLYLGLKRYRETEGEGYLTFQQGFQAGLVYSFVYSTLSAMLILLLGVIFDAGFLDVFQESNLQQIGETKDVVIEYLGRDTYEEMVKGVQESTVSDLSFSDFQTKFVGSIILTLILAAVFMKKPPIVEETE